MKRIPEEITVTLNEKQMSELKEEIVDVVRDEISAYNLILNKALDTFLKKRDRIEKDNTVQMDIIRRIVNGE